MKTLKIIQEIGFLNKAIDYNKSLIVEEAYFEETKLKNAYLKAIVSVTEDYKKELETLLDKMHNG